MVTEADREWARNESRMKAERDYWSFIHGARQEGEAIGRIHALEDLVGQPLTPREQLVGLPLEELTRRADELEAQLPPLSIADSEWIRYETRRTFWLDFKAELDAIRLRGEQVGRMHTYQRLLHREQTPAEELHHHSLEYLTRRANALELWFER